MLVGGAQVLLTTRNDGTMRPAPHGDVLEAERDETRRRSILDRQWTFVHQVHGNSVCLLDKPSGPLEVDADALVSTSPEVALAVLGADCALVGLSSHEGVIAAVHAGWRGLMAGVLETTAEQMRRLGATEIRGVCGPFVRKECYPFAEPELGQAAAALGPSVRARLSPDREALDMEIALGRSCTRAGIVLEQALGGCTCDLGFYSERARKDPERHCLVIFRSG